ncbi:hypothetical protein PVN22_21975 [Bacillus licheniformis]|uniref:hypothetical protein n=1 Tax=Bacillus licheniformis TaxID=1402 RepID=UPI00237D1EFA|nr:hypothetical protein [Bacillus licheniformis]MDE1433722.1 hypothetical protein [Bacillus licheniformis]
MVATAEPTKKKRSLFSAANEEKGLFNLLKNFFFEAKHQTPVEKGGRKISVSSRLAESNTN